MNANVYTVTIHGENNSFTVEAIPEYEPIEDWLSNRVIYRTHLDSVKLVHGNRRREVLPILTAVQKKHLISEIDRINCEDWYEYQRDQAEAEHYDRLQQRLTGVF